MPSKRLILILGILVMMIGTAAFIGGKLLNREFDPLRSVRPSKEISDP